jgi:xylulokinase
MGAMQDATVLAADLGGSSLRVALVGREGAIRALHAAPWTAGSEADPDTWWRGVQEGAAALARAEPRAFARIAAVAVTAFTRALVLLDAAGAAIRPAILFGDARAEAEAAALRDRLEPTHPETREINAFHPLARLAWLQRHEPAALARSVAAIEPKDEINRRLTGVVASDPISSARLLASAGLLAPLGLPPLLPPMRRPGAVLGRVRPLPGPLGPLAGLPVLTMSHDTWAAVTGLGAMRAGLGYCISGTTEVLGVLHDTPAAAPGLIGVDWDGLWQLGGPSQHGADALAWLRGLGIAAEPAPDLVPILFLPSLSGERVPHWDPALRGAFLGLHRAHDAAAMAQAVMQGVALNNLSVLRRAEAATGRAVAEIRLGGGGASPGWARLRADILGRPVVTTACPEPGLLGCAIAAFATLEGRGLAELQDAMARPAARFLPDPARQDRARRLHALFLDAEAAVAPLSHALAGFS